MKIKYRDYTIYYDRDPTPLKRDWSFVHENYDGPEDLRCGKCSHIETCIMEIDDIESELIHIDSNSNEILKAHEKGFNEGVIACSNNVISSINNGTPLFAVKILLEGVIEKTKIKLGNLK
jgi:hypothetical protein